MIMKTENFSTLEAICDANYKELRDPSALLAVEKFLLTHRHRNNIQHLSTPLLRKILKIASLAKNQFTITQAGAQYGIATYSAALTNCAEGISRLTREIQAEKNPESNEKTRALSHFYNFAGNFHWRISKIVPASMDEEKRKAHQLTHLKDAYDRYSTAINLGIQARDDSPVSYTFAHRASVAAEIAELKYGTEKIQWFTRAVNDTLESAERTKILAPRHSAFQYSHSSKYEFKVASLARKTPQKQIQFLRSAISHAQQSLSVTNMPENYNAGVNYDIGKYADMLWKHTHDQKDVKTAIEHYKKAIDYFNLHPDSKNGFIKAMAETRMTLLERMTIAS